MRIAFFPLFVAIIFFCACAPSYKETKIPLDSYKIEQGFQLEVLASEPLLKAPVAMDFDDRGRMWVAQMPGYMNDMQGSDEDKPVGSIRILEDLDGDGITDHAKVFLDSLVMPRALAHVYGGLLYAEPPNLWFVEIEKDRPVNRVLVDSIYAAVGNPEHQPNGLLMNVDNWIYSAKSNFRYRRHKGTWLKEPTTFRGQWGIAQDDFGRLYYNDNSRLLLGDFVLPNTVINNPYHLPKASVDRLLTKDQRVYPLHATMVNRGYAEGVLNADSILVATTAACSPLVYRGGQFPPNYAGNVFVCLPEANAVKRMVLNFTGDATLAEHAWKGKEFLAATDEGFRPVALRNGPDGSLYIVDMHRGMIGHHAYLSPYLKEKNKVVRLDTLVDYGRILRVKANAAKPISLPDIDRLSPNDWIALLSSENGWLRDRAQQLLVHHSPQGYTAEVTMAALDPSNGMGQIHALYVLEAWEALSLDVLAQLMEKGGVEVASHALVLSKHFLDNGNLTEVLSTFKKVLARNSLMLDVYLSSVLGHGMALDAQRFTPLMAQVTARHPQNKVVMDGLMSGLGVMDLSDTLPLASMVEPLERSMVNRQNEKMNPIYSRQSLNEDNRTSGAKLFHQICASCHGVNGGGIDGLAPPLMNSEYVANTEQLALILLHGLVGPIHVNGEAYDLNLAMPGLIRNENISDKDIADIISYVTNAFSDVPKTLSEERIQVLRTVKSSTGMEYTEQELRNVQVAEKHHASK
jgi:mono/diheme cytochrome c family protein/nicotinamide riboside kinase